MKPTIHLSLAILAFAATTTGAFAQAGTLDPDFATAGIGTYLTNGQFAKGYDMIALADNSMLVCGTAYQDNTYKAFVTHLLEDGTVDIAFGESNGYTFFEADSYGFAMALATDQSIYLAGTSPQYDMLLAHLTPAGIPDTDFGPNGVVYTPIPPNIVAAEDLLIQPDGKLVVGYSPFGINSNNLVVRYLPDGTLDTGFNGTGIATFDPYQAGLTAVTLMDDGSIVGCGMTSPNGMILLKLNADGTQDVTFGTNGILSFSFGDFAYEEAFGIMVNEGSIYVVGDVVTNANIEKSYIAKFNADGTLDTSFGTDGSTMSEVGGGSLLKDLAMQSDGKIVACGSTFDNSTQEIYMLAMRFDMDGMLDLTFGDAGNTVTNLPGIDSSELFCIAVQPDGKIVATGYDFGTQLSVVVLRYLGDGTIGIADTNMSSRSAALYPNPVAGHSTTLRLPDAFGAEVWISDLQGQMLGRRINVAKGMSSVALSTSDLAAGNYFVNVQSQGTKTSLQMQVVK